MVRVFVADDHAIVREGLKQIISETPDLQVAGEASTGQGALEGVRRTACDVVLLDINMPHGSGLDVLRQLKAEFPKLPILILSMYPEDQYAVRVLRGGGAGYLTKESAPEELVKAIRKVAGGGKFISPSVAEHLAFHLEVDPDRAPHEALSDREFEVLRLIASGRTVSEIAEELSLSVKTISTYRTRVLEKMSMKTNAEVTHYAIRNNLV